MKQPQKHESTLAGDFKVIRLRRDLSKTTDCKDRDRPVGTRRSRLAKMQQALR